MRIKQPNFIKYSITKSDIGKKQIKVKDVITNLPFKVTKKDVGKVVAVNLNSKLRRNKI